MESNLSVILSYVFGSTTLIGAITFIVFWRQNKKLKENEVKVSSADAQKQDIDLSDYFKDKMLSMMDEFSERQKKGSENQQQMMDKMKELKEQNSKQDAILAKLVERADKQERSMADLVEYMNGEYQDHLKRKYGKA